MVTPDDPRHGTVNGYKNLRCRCDACREANRRYFSEGPGAAGQARYRAKFIAAGLTTAGTPRKRPWYGPAGPPHGLTRYQNYGCRCDLCVEASRASQQARRDRNVAAGLTTTGKPRKRRARAEHGTWTMYTNHGCRCDQCLPVGKTKIRERNARTRERRNAWQRARRKVAA